MDNELNQIEQIDSVLDNIAQIDSILGEIVVISSNFMYSGQIELNDWEEIGNSFFYTIAKETHTLGNPCVIKFDVYNGENFENAMVSYTVNEDDDVTFKVDEKVVAKFKIEGEK